VGVGVGVGVGARVCVCVCVCVRACVRPPSVLTTRLAVWRQAFGWMVWMCWPVKRASNSPSIGVARAKVLSSSKPTLTAITATLCLTRVGCSAAACCSDVAVLLGLHN